MCQDEDSRPDTKRKKSGGRGEGVEREWGQNWNLFGIVPTEKEGRGSGV